MSVKVKGNVIVEYGDKLISELTPIIGNHTDEYNFKYFSFGWHNFCNGEDDFLEELNNLNFIQVDPLLEKLKEREIKEFEKEKKKADKEHERT